jgi:hypothetical protein
MMTSSGQPLVAETLARMDDGWAAFHARVHKLPSQLLEHHIADGARTRKQMLAHIATWHDLTTERLTSFVGSGEAIDPPDDGELINTRAARAAIGRTTGEVLLDLDHSYRQLRRKVASLLDTHLTAHDDWAAAIIAGNTYGHYSEHLADLGG